MNLTAIFCLFLLVLTSGWAKDDFSSQPVSYPTDPSNSTAENVVIHATESNFGRNDGLSNIEIENLPVISAESIKEETVSSESSIDEFKETAEKQSVFEEEQSSVPLPNDPEPAVPDQSEHIITDTYDAAEPKPFTSQNDLPRTAEENLDDDAEYLSLEELNLINEIVKQIPSSSGPNADTLEAKADRVLELINKNESVLSDNINQVSPLDETIVEPPLSLADLPQIDKIIESANAVYNPMPNEKTSSVNETNNSEDLNSALESNIFAEPQSVLSEPKELPSQSALPESISLGQINLNLLPPFAEPSIRQFQVNMSLPLLNQIELSVTLQELLQGEVSPNLFETIYQVGALFGSVPSIAQGDLSLLSGTLTVISSQAIQLENLASTMDSWKDVQFQLHQESANLLFVGKVEKSSPSSDAFVKYQSEISFQIGPISGKYHLRLERQGELSEIKKQPCPWLSLDHELTTTPEDVFYFHSFIDHICKNNGAENVDSDDSQMKIAITLKSAVWPLANFNLNQTFNFGFVGNEVMQASHPLFDIAVDGFWNSDSIYSKTLKISPSAIGTHLLPFLPSNLKAIFTRIQQGDGLSKEYTLNIEKSPNLTKNGHQEQVTTSNRLSLSSLVVKIISAFISATTIVFSANGAIFTEFVSHFEFLLDLLFALIDEQYFVYFDLHQLQLAFELTAFLIIILLCYMLLSFVDLLDTVIRIVLIVLFVEICVATIGVQLISLGYM